MPNQSPEKLQEVVNMAFHDLATPLRMMHSWVALLAEAHEEQDEELMRRCIEFLQINSQQIDKIWQMMRDVYFSKTE